ncbi:MAG TPA: hypothetical protein VGA36_06455 [Nitriliruptorales bacterium]
MPKRRDVMRAIERAAAAADLPTTAREGANHTLLSIGSTTDSVPRHRELARFTAEAIFERLERELGPRWWT